MYTQVMIIQVSVLFDYLGTVPMALPPDDQALKQSAHPTIETFLRSLNKNYVKSMFDRVGILTHADLLDVSLNIRIPQNRDDLRKSLLEQGMTLCDWFTIAAGVQEYSLGVLST